MILVAHGAKPNATRLAFIDRNMLNLQRVEDYFQHLPHKLVDLEIALAGEGDALTIDDATRAGAAMASAARQAGHDVTLFVNPGYVSGERPYYFHLLTLLVSRCESCLYNGNVLPSATVQEKKQVRKLIKHDLLDVPMDDDKLGLVMNLFEENGIEFQGLPDHLQTLTIEDLQHLTDLGVRLENHGWEHPHYRVLTVNQRCSQIRDGKDWLRSFNQNFGDFFAVPYGDHVPGPEIKFAGSCWFGVAETGRPASRDSYIERVALRL